MSEEKVKKIIIMSEQVENTTDTNSSMSTVESNVEQAIETNTTDNVDDGSDNKKLIEEKEPQEKCSNSESTADIEIETKSVQSETEKSIEMEAIPETKFEENKIPEIENSEMTEEKPVEDVPTTDDSVSKNHPKDQEMIEEKDQETPQKKDDETQKETSQENDCIMVTENTVTITDNKTKEDTNRIGSLGLLNQYSSSSDEEEDSTSSEEDSDSEDDTESSQVIETPAVEDKDKELNTLANCILNNVMSRENYREADQDT